MRGVAGVGSVAERGWWRRGRGRRVGCDRRKEAGRGGRCRKGIGKGRKGRRRDGTPAAGTGGGRGGNRWGKREERERGRLGGRKWEVRRCDVVEL